VKVLEGLEKNEEDWGTKIKVKEKIEARAQGLPPSLPP
jgi:hypothetical protein